MAIISLNVSYRLPLLLTLSCLLLACSSESVSLPAVNVTIFAAGIDAVCVRFPAITQVGNNTVLAFALCSDGPGDGCISRTGPPNRNGICMKRSHDSGKTWGELKIPCGGMAGSQPTVVYDSVNKTTILMGCLGGHIYSYDDGETWLGRPGQPFKGHIRPWHCPLNRSWMGTVACIWGGHGPSTFPKDFRGPGRGLQLKRGPKAGRILFIAGGVAYYSDDHGLTFNASTMTNTSWPEASESQLVELSNGTVAAYCRSSWTMPHGGKVVMHSDDSGLTFGPIFFDMGLSFPGSNPNVMSSIVSFDRNDAPTPEIFFSAPLNAGRDHMTVHKSSDDTKTWNQSIVVEVGHSVYSCLTTLPADDQMGILWESGSGCTKNASGAICRLAFTAFPRSMDRTPTRPRLSFSTPYRPAFSAPDRDPRRPAPVTLASGTTVSAHVIANASEHFPEWHHADVPASVIAKQNDTRVAMIADARWFPFSGEGPNECATAVLADGKSVFVAIRMGAGDYAPGSGYANDTTQYTTFIGPGYYDYYGTISRDEGLTWSPLLPMGAGSASPTLLRVGSYLLLSGGRHCNSAAGSDVSLWFNADGMATSWEHYSLSYRHNLGALNASDKFTSGVNTSCRSQTSAYTSMSLISSNSFAVHYDGPGGKYAINVTISDDRPIANERTAVPLQQDNSIPLPGCFVDSRTTRQLREHVVCAAGEGPCATLTREYCGSQCKALGYPLAGVEASHECSCGHALTSPSKVVPITECNETCTGNYNNETCGGFLRIWVFDSSSVGPPPPLPPTPHPSPHPSPQPSPPKPPAPPSSTTISGLARLGGDKCPVCPPPHRFIAEGGACCCDNSRHAFWCTGETSPLIIFLARPIDVNQVPVAPTCRVDPYRGGSIHVAKGVDPNATNTSLNYVTFPATVLNSTAVSCVPPAVTASGPGLLRFSLDNQTWEGETGVDGVPIEYFDMIQMAFDRRPYVSEATGHLLVRTHPMLCENGFTIVNATTASGQSLFAGLKAISGDRPVPFDLTSLPATVHEDVMIQVLISGNNLSVTRPLRFIRATSPTISSVQIDQSTKSLLVGNEPFLGSGYVYNGYSTAQLLEFAGRLPALVKSGVNVGVLKTLPSANATVQRVVLDAAAASGFKIVWPLSVTGPLSAPQRELVQRVMREKALLGYWLCDDCCSRSHAEIRALAQAYADLKTLDPFHVTFGAVNCDSTWLFGEAPSTVSGRLTSQLSLDVPALVDYGERRNHMSGVGVNGRDTNYFRHRIWASPIASMPGLNGPEITTAAAVTAAMWMGVAVTESYISIAWAGPEHDPSWDAGIAEYQRQRQAFDPHTLGAFGSTGLSVVIAPPANQTIRGRAWYHALTQQARVVLVHSEQGQGDIQPTMSTPFSASVVQTFNPRLLFASFSSTIAPGTSLMLEMGPTM